MLIYINLSVAGNAAHYGLYLGTFIMAGTGVSMGYFGGNGLPFFWTKFNSPPKEQQNGAIAKNGILISFIISNLFLLAFKLHSYCLFIIVASLYFLIIFIISLHHLFLFLLFLIIISF